MKRYFYITIHFSPDYEGTVFSKHQDNLYINTETGEIYRKRLLYDFGWGQENGFELIPQLSFDGLIELIERPMVLPQKKFWQKHTKEEIQQADIWRSNLYGAVAVIMQDYAEELIGFLSAKVDTDYFSNPSIRDNFKCFSFDSQKTRAEGKTPGGVLTRSYEDILKDYPQWGRISSKVINQISGVGSDIRRYNLFAYCFNNPVNMSDPTGNWPRLITATVAAVAAVVAVVATVVSAPVVAMAAAAVAVVSTVAYVAQSHHYDKRKAKNTNLPQTPQEADDLNWRNSNTKSNQNPNGGGPAADCHQYTSPDKSNVKYVSPDGHREVIYNSAGNIVLDSRDIGTYNFSPSGTFGGSVGHFFADMVPWFLFGNDDDDPGPLVNEIIRLFE